MSFLISSIKFLFFFALSLNKKTCFLFTIGLASLTQVNTIEAFLCRIEFILQILYGLRQKQSRYVFLRYIGFSKQFHQVFIANNTMTVHDFGKLDKTPSNIFAGNRTRSFLSCFLFYYASFNLRIDSSFLLFK